MSASVLVTYATRYGSTEEVAQAIAASLRRTGLEVDVRPARKVSTLEGYSAVLLGAPLYMFRWHKDALRFLRRRREALEALPVAVFALGPIHDEEMEWVDVRTQLDKALAKFPWFAPSNIRIFGGKFDPGRLRLPHSLLPPMRRMPASDIRDWAAIDAWAAAVASTLK